MIDNTLSAFEVEACARAREMVRYFGGMPPERKAELLALLGPTFIGAWCELSQTPIGSARWCELLDVVQVEIQRSLIRHGFSTLA